MELLGRNMIGLNHILIIDVNKRFYTDFDLKEGILCGIPQVLILSSLLFLIYINDLPNCLESTVPCLYADDT